MGQRKLPEAMKATQFVKGQIANKNGPTPKTPAQKKINADLRNLTLDTYREILHRLLFDTVPGLKELVSDKDTNALTAAVAMCLLMAIKKGDYDTIEKILQRIIGKIPDHLSVVSNITNTVICKIDPVKLKEAMDKIESEI